MSVPIALQLYTVRDETANDFAGTVRQVAQMGYSGIELAGTGGLSAAEMSDLLAETGLRVAGSHIMVDMFQEQLDEVISYYTAIGARYVGIPALPGELRTIDGFKTVARLMNSAGKALQDAGLTLYYHNHNFEFFDLGGGVRGMDILLNETDPAVAKFEIDCYWAVYAGVDPSELIAAHAGRYPLIHLKDMTGEGEARTFAEVGEGVIDWQPVFAASEAQGAEWYIVEQDRCARPTLESARLSIDNLKSWGKG